MAEPKVVSLERGTLLKLIEKRVTDPTVILDQIGAFVMNEARKSFRLQRRDKFQWKARKVPSVAGILQDLEAGRPPHPSRFQERPALFVTGRLRDSITFRRLGTKAVEIGSDLEYAALHNFGGESVISITKKIKDGMRAFLKTGRGKQHQKELQKFTRKRKKKHTQRVPARPFISVTPGDREKIKRLIGAAVLTKSEAKRSKLI